MTRLDDAFDSVVDVEEGVGVFELAHHGGGEGIVFLGTVEGYELDGSGFLGGFGDVRDADFCEVEI